MFRPSGNECSFGETIRYKEIVFGGSEIHKEMKKQRELFIKNEFIMDGI